MYRYKLWHLICTECEHKHNVHAWTHDLPELCLRCGAGYYEDAATGPVFKPQETRRAEKDEAVIVKELEELRWPEHLGG